MRLHLPLRALCGVALACALPLAASGTASAQTGRARGGHVTTKHKKHVPLYVLTLSPTMSFPTASDEVIPPGRPANNQAFVDGSLYVRVAPHLRAFAKYINHADTGGSRFKSKKPTYGSFNRDTENQEGLAWDFAPQLALAVAYRERHRACCPAAGDPTNPAPRFYTGVLAGLSYNFGWHTDLGLPFRAYVEETYVNHHLDAGVKIPKGQSDGGKKTLFKGAITSVFRVWGQNRFVPYFTYQNFESYFNNQLQPSHTNRTIVGVRIKGNRFVSYQAYVKNDHQYGAGADVPHSVNLFLVASFKLSGG